MFFHFGCAQRNILRREVDLHTISSQKTQFEVDSIYTYM